MKIKEIKIKKGEGKKWRNCIKNKFKCLKIRYFEVFFSDKKMHKYNFFWKCLKNSFLKTQQKAFMRGSGQISITNH